MLIATPKPNGLNRDKPSDKYVDRSGDGKLSINPAYDLKDVLNKLYYYELIEDEYHNYIPWILFGKYEVDCTNYEELCRTIYGYTLPIDAFLKTCPNATNRTINALRKNGIEQVKDLISTKYPWSWCMIDKIPGIGKEQHKELHRSLLKLRDWVNHGYNTDGETEFITLEENPK